MSELSAPACRAARAVLGWSAAKLAEKSGVSLPTIQRIESGKDFYASTGVRLIETFAANNVEILNGDRPGARLLAPES